MKLNKAFTVIEMLVVLAIVAMAGCLTITVFQAGKNKQLVSARAADSEAKELLESDGFPSAKECEPGGGHHDFVLESATARSNALAGNYAPPEGFVVVCNQNGLYCPKVASDDYVFDGIDSTWSYATTNRRKAVIACWRIKEIQKSRDETPRNPLQTNHWVVCE